MITHRIGLQQEQRREGVVLSRAQSRTSEKDASDLQLLTQYSDWIVDFKKLPYSDPTARTSYSAYTAAALGQVGCRDSGLHVHIFKSSIF